MRKSILEESLPMSEAAPSAPNAPLWMETGMGGGESQNCDPPKYSDVVRPANQGKRLQ